MQKLYFESPVSAPLEQVRDGFNLDLFKALKPPIVSLDVTRFDGCKKGDEVHLSVGLGLKVKWVSHITADHESQDEWSFVDEGALLPFPLKKWHHHHRVLRSTNGSIIIDDISFSCGNALFDTLMKPALFLQFVGRKSVYQRIFGRPQEKPE
jgi:ligand-binding SRPBCC domain-containing protein